MDSPASEVVETPLSAPIKKAVQERVLDPDNPLLERFQAALKEHLQRQIETLNEDIFEYETEAKKKGVEKEALGVQVYEEQQNVTKQQITLKSFVERLENVTKAREETENQLNERRKVFRTTRTQLIEAENKEFELRKEMESVNFLHRQIIKWETDLESNITIRQRMLEKTRKDKSRLVVEKRLQDLLIYKLMTRIWQLENDLNQMDIQIKIKEEEREELATTVVQGNINIEAITMEYKNLMHSWNSVIVAVGNRDKILNCLGKEANKLEEQFKSIISEIEQVKKLARKEMQNNERLTIFKERIVKDLQNCKFVLESEREKKILIETDMSEMQAVIDQTELDIEKIEQENRLKNDLLALLMRDFDTLNRRKGSFEEEIMNSLEDQITNDKAAINLNRMLRQLKEKNRDLEIALSLAENKAAKAKKDAETQRSANGELDKLMQRIEKEFQKLESEYVNNTEQLKKIEIEIVDKQREIDLLNAKLSKVIEKTSSGLASPLDLKIYGLEKGIDEIQTEIKTLQRFWLVQQTNVLALSGERQKQWQNNTLLSKQIMILEQKNLRISDELESNRLQQDKVQRNINFLQNRLAVLSNSLFKKKDYKSSLDRDNDLIKQDYVFKLKDGEMECLKLEEQIMEIEEDKVNLSRDLIEKNRTALEWEKKFKLAKETKENIGEEKGQGGEVGNMKAEIHRMNVRYGQLKKAQDKLLLDLEHCVSRRDAIYMGAEAREKRVKGASDKTRVNFQRKMDDMRNKIKQMETEITQLDGAISEAESEKQLVECEQDSVENALKINQERLSELEEELGEAITKRQMNFELLLQIQKKIALYTDLIKGRKPYTIYRTESLLTTEYNKQREINARLCKIIENLLSDFPNYKHDFDRILNTLKLSVLIAY